MRRRIIASAAVALCCRKVSRSSATGRSRLSRLGGRRQPLAFAADRGFESPPPPAASLERTRHPDGLEVIDGPLPLVERGKETLHLLTHRGPSLGVAAS